MNATSKEIYKFGGFLFDVDNQALYYKEELISSKLKYLEILTILLRRPGKLITHNEIIGQIWENSSQGKIETDIAPHVTQLRKILKQYKKKSDYIPTRTRGGYLFADDGSLENVQNSQLPEQISTENFLESGEKRDRRRK